MRCLLVFTILIGVASQYDPGVMDQVIKYQQAKGAIPEDLERYDGFVATPDCNIGNVIVARPVGSAEWESFLVVDCAGGDGAYTWMTRNNILVEVDYETAKRWSTVGRAISIEQLIVSKECKDE